MAGCRIGIGRDAVKSILPDEVPVVIDTLRAASTIVTALASGVTEIIPVACDEEAFRLKEQGMVIAGESGGVKLPGFDLGNSPLEVQNRIQRSPCKTMAFKTSNMVPLLLMLSRAWICSSLNLSIMAHHLKGTDVSIIAVGGEHGVTEDLAVAIALFGLLSNAPFDEHLITYFIQESPAARHLSTIGYRDDVMFISRVNIYDVLPYYDGRTIKNRYVCD